MIRRSRLAATNHADDAGNAVVEFIVLGVLLLVPMVYIMLAVLRVQGSAYGVSEAARESGRAFVEAPSSAVAYAHACTAATLALANQVPGAFDCASHLHITCDAAGARPCDALVPGSTVHVEIRVDVSLPFLPRSIFGESMTVPLHATHDEVVDPFRAAR